MVQPVSNGPGGSAVQTALLRLTSYRGRFRLVVRPVGWSCACQRASSPRAGGFLTSGYLSTSTKYIWLRCSKFLTKCGRAHQGQLRRAQLVIGVDNSSVVDTSKQGRSKIPPTHETLGRLSKLQIDQVFWFSMRWNGR